MTRDLGIGGTTKEPPMPTTTTPPPAAAPAPPSAAAASAPPSAAASAPSSAAAAPAPSSNAATVARRLELATTGEADALPRVLGWLRRRGCTFTRVEYHVADRHGPGRFVVAVRAPRRQADRLGRGLENIVGVLAVRVD
jgi:hypothetical protein